jgi:hypothetical protein
VSQCAIGEPPLRRGIGFARDRQAHLSSNRLFVPTDFREVKGPEYVKRARNGGGRQAQREHVVDERQ